MDQKSYIVLYQIAKNFKKVNFLQLMKCILNNLKILGAKSTSVGYSTLLLSPSTDFLVNVTSLNTKAVLKVST